MARLWLGAVLVVAAVATAVAFWLLRGDDGADAGQLSRADDPRMCTLIGCAPGVAVVAEGLQQDLPQARRLLLCVDGTECRLSRVPGRGRYANVAYASNFKRLRPVDVEFFVLGGSGETLRDARLTTRLRPYYPNGKGCGRCARLDLFYNVGANELVVDRGEVGAGGG